MLHFFILGFTRLSLIDGHISCLMLP